MTIVNYDTPSYWFIGLMDTLLNDNTVQII